MTDQEIRDGAPDGATEYWDYPSSGLSVDYYKRDGEDVYILASWLENPEWLINNRLESYDIKPL